MKVLIVVDMQNDFVTGPLGTPEARAIVPKMKKYVENFDGMVFFTKDTHDENYLKTQEGKHLPIEHCIINTDGWKLIPEFDVVEKWGLSNIFSKSSFAADNLFVPVFIENCAKDDKIEGIYLCGVCTGICVLNNALMLKNNYRFYKDVPIYVIEDLCACVTPETHKEAIDIMKLCHIDIINSDI